MDVSPHVQEPRHNRFLEEHAIDEELPMQDALLCLEEQMIVIKSCNKNDDVSITLNLIYPSNERSIPFLR